MPLTPEQRRLSAQIAANARWSREDGHANAARARAGLRAKFEREVDPDGTLDEAERMRRADCAERAHMQRMALKSARARRERAGGDAA